VYETNEMAISNSMQNSEETNSKLCSGNNELMMMASKKEKSILSGKSSQIVIMVDILWKGRKWCNIKTISHYPTPLLRCLK